MVTDVIVKGETVSIEYKSSDGETNYCHMLMEFWNGLKRTHGSDDAALKAYFSMVNAAGKYD